MAGESRLALDFETGNTSRFSGIEAGSPSTQAVVTQAVVRSGWGNYTCKVQDGNNIKWNNFIRCLLARYDSNETVNQEYFFAFSHYYPTGANTISNSQLLWELHHPSSLYNLSGLGVAPHAITINNGNLYCRLAAGNGTVGSGYAVWYPNNLLYTSVPFNQWIDFIVNIKFSEGNDGYVKYYVDATGTATFSQGSPTFALTGLATMPYCNSQNVHNVLLYTEMGLYNNGGSGAVQNDYDEYYMTGHRRELTWAAATASWGGTGGSAPPPTPSPTSHEGNWTTPKFINATVATVTPQAPPELHIGNWTTPSYVDSTSAATTEAEGTSLSLDGVAPGSLAATQKTAGSLTLTPHPSGSL